MFGFKLFSPTTTIYSIRVGIYVNGVCKGFGGEYTYTNEAITCILDVLQGDSIDVRCFSGTALFYMAALHSWFYGHKLTPANNLITSSTTLNVSQVNAGSSNFSTCNSSTLNASTINGDISSNLSAGLNTSLTTTSGVTQISSILSSWISLILASNYSPGSGTGYNIIYDTTLSGNLSYNGSTGAVTIPATGLYAISGSLVFDVASGTSRVNTRIRMRVNNSFTGGYAQAYGYSRYATEVSLSTATFPEWIGQLTAGDLITMRAEIAVGTNNQFNSSWTGYQIVNGSTLTIKRIT